jgi:hypothetical protein
MKEKGIWPVKYIHKELERRKKGKDSQNHRPMNLVLPRVRSVTSRWVAAVGGPHKGFVRVDGAFTPEQLGKEKIGRDVNRRKGQIVWVAWRRKEASWESEGVLREGQKYGFNRFIKKRKSKKKMQTAAVWTAGITAGKHGSGGSSISTVTVWAPLFTFFLVVIIYEEYEKKIN